MNQSEERSVFGVQSQFRIVIVPRELFGSARIFRVSVLESSLSLSISSKTKLRQF